MSSVAYAREAAFRALFQLDFTQADSEEKELYEKISIENALEDFEKLSEKHLQFVEDRVKGTRLHLAEIDELIQKNLRKGWTVKRLATADRNILRLAVYEMKFAEDKLEKGIAISEALRLAKKYSADNSRSFVNGILEAITK